MTPTVTESNLGAWLLRCNPKIWDLAGFIDDGETAIGNWSVVDNYRSRMMSPGDRVVFWVTGQEKQFQRGIWGTGHVTGPTHDAIPRALDPGEIDYWLSEAARMGVENYADVDIALFETGITDLELKAAGINDLEVQLQPQGSNPSWISTHQLARLEAVLPSWPERADVDEQITVSDRGAGYGDPHHNRVVEAAAMAAVRLFYEAGKWTVLDVSHDNVGWDLTCTHRSGEIAKVEVKGVSGDRSVVLLTANEVRAAAMEPGWVLAVVTRAVSHPLVTEFSAEHAVRAAEPYVYKAVLA